MTPVPQTHTDEKLIRLLKAAHVLDLEEAPREHSQRTPKCPSLPRFAVARTQGWTEDEQRHIFEEKCIYCQKVLAMFDRAGAAKHPTDVPGRSATPRAVADVLTAAKSNTAVQATLTGATALIRSGRVGDLEDRLRPWLPFRLRWAGLTDDLDEALAQLFLVFVLDFVRTRFEEVRQHRFRDLLPVWLSDFARQQNLAARLRPDRLSPSATDLEADAVERVLRRAGEHEAPWAKAFREAALHASVRTAQGLLSFETAEARDIRALPNYRRDLFSEARREYRKGLELFECDVSA
jgi:hypothetical protein